MTDAQPNRLRVLMAMLDVTQSEVAGGAALAQPTISDIYSGNYTDLKYGTVQRIAEFFGCQVEDIFPKIEPAAVSTNQPALPFRRRAASR